MTVKASSEIPTNGTETSDKAAFKKLLGDIVASIHKRSDSYFWKLIGDSPESLSTLFDCEQHPMIHILGQCDLYDEASKKYAKGIRDNSKCFSPCEITWNKQRGESMQYYLQIEEATPGSMKSAARQYSKGKLLVHPNSRRKGNEAVHKPRLTDNEQRMIKELITLATSSFCSKPNVASITRKTSKEKRSPPAAKVKPPAKHPKCAPKAPPTSRKSMVADEQILQDMINELEKSFTSILFNYGKGSIDPAAILSKYLL
jgi:hypothetical protein